MWRFVTTSIKKKVTIFYDNDFIKMVRNRSLIKWRFIQTLCVNNPAVFWGADDSAQYGLGRRVILRHGLPQWSRDRDLRLRHFRNEFEEEPTPEMIAANIYNGTTLIVQSMIQMDPPRIPTTTTFLSTNWALPKSTTTLQIEISFGFWVPVQHPYVSHFLSRLHGSPLAPVPSRSIENHLFLAMTFPDWLRLSRLK